ncbi:hypothetical protein C0989_007056, partial [Termitomyces sp. Mn162]
YALMTLIPTTCISPMAASGSHPKSNSGPPPALSLTSHCPCTCFQPPSLLGHLPKTPSSLSVAMADIPKLDDMEGLAGEVSDSAMEDLKVDYEDPQFEGPGKHHFEGHIIPAPLPSDNMMQSDEASADMARAMPVPPFSAGQANSVSPWSPSGLLAPTQSVPTIIFSPAHSSPCATPPPRVSSSLPMATYPPSPASCPLSPRKAAKQWAFKQLAVSPTPQLSVDSADTFLHSLAMPSAPLHPGSCLSTCSCYFGYSYYLVGSTCRPPSEVQHRYLPGHSSSYAAAAFDL